MKNLKRALSLALSAFMLVGMMAVGASASFSDADTIENTDAVNTMVALNIIKGKDDGSFDPEGTVTRAEMAKMICVALNGGTDPNLTSAGLYPDTKGHWAAGYIDYCTNLGIVAGDNNGNFNPANPVTTVEAAKMMLIAMGYNAQTEKFVNDANWAINIGVIASARGLYKGISALADAPLSRDNAAQMIFNGIQAEMVEYKIVGIVDGTGVSAAYQNNKTILSEMYETYAEAPEGVITKITYNSTKEEWTYSVGTKMVDGSPVAAYTFTTDKDFTDLMGQNVRVIAKDDGKVVYGIFENEGSVLAEGYLADYTLDSVKKEVKLDGTKADVDAGYKAIEAMTGVTIADPTKLAGTASMKLVDTDGNGDADLVVVTPFDVKKVSYVGKTSFTAGGSFEFDKVNVYEDIAKGDYVTVTDEKFTSDKTTTIAKVEAATGTVTGKKTVDGTYKFLIDGEWYTKADNKDDLAVNDVVEYVAFGSEIYMAKVTDSEKASTDLAVVVSASKNTDTLGGNDKAALIFVDGSKKTVVTDKDYTSLTGKLVTYHVNNDDEYELTEVTKELGDYEKFGKEYDTDKNGKIDTLGGFEIADDAVVFLFGWDGANANTPDAENAAKVITGADVKTLTAAGWTGAFTLADNIKGFNYAKVSLLTAPKATYDAATVGESASYGYVVSDSYQGREDGKDYNFFTIWNGEAELNVKSEDKAAAGLKAGTLIAYDAVNETTVKNVKAAGAEIGYVDGWDEDEKISINGETYKVTEDTTVLYINSEDKEGVAGGVISIADDPKDDGKYVNNVYRLGDKGEALKLLVVDVNNKMITPKA